MSLRFQPWCQGTKSAQERWCLGSVGGKKRNEQKTHIKCLRFYENTIPCLTFVKNHRLISWRAETNKSMYHLHAYPTPEFYKDWAVLLFYHEISFWKQWKSIFPLRWLVIPATWCSLQIFRLGGKCYTSSDGLLWTDTSNTILLAQESVEQDLSHWPGTPLLLGVLAQWVKAGCILTLPGAAGEQRQWEAATPACVHFHLGHSPSRHIVTFKQ